MEGPEAFPTAPVSDRHWIQETGKIDQYAEAELTKSEDQSGSGSCLSVLSTLRTDYGMQLLIMISLCSHWCKGFCRSQYMQSIRYLLQSWMLSGSRLDTLASVIEMPWSLKPMVAICSDMFPIFGFRKLPYILVTSMFGIAGLCVACFISPDDSEVEVPVIGLFFATLSWMTCDILVEGVYSRRMRLHAESGPDLVVYISVGQQVTVLFSSLVSGFVIEHMDGVLSLTGAQWNISLCLIPTVLVLVPTFLNFIHETKVSAVQAMADRRVVYSSQKEVIALSLFTCFGSLVYVTVGVTCSDSQTAFLVALVVLFAVNFFCWFLFQPVVGRLVLFLAIASACNLSIGGPAHYFYTDTADKYPEGPHFDPWFLVTVCGFVGAIAGIAATLLFSLFKRATFRTVYVIFIILNALLTIPNSLVFARINVKWGISDYVFVGSDTALQAVTGMLYFMPGFLLLSRICPNKIESTMFAILASNTNLAQTITYPISGYLCEAFGIAPNGGPFESAQFANLWIANLVISGVKLVPLLFITLLPICRMTDAVVDGDASVTNNSPLRRFTLWWHKS